MPTLTSILTECAEDLLNTEDRVHPDQVVSCAYNRYGDVFADETNRLVWDAARRIAKSVMRKFSEDDDGQQRLPGLHLPTAIAVPQEHGQYAYVQSEKATWADLQAGRTVRVDNVERAQARLDLYDDSLERLRPFMENDASCSVAEALRREAEAA